MKGKKFLSLILGLLVCLGLASCAWLQPPTQTNPQTNPPVSNPATNPTDGPTNNHQDPYNKSLAEGAVVRDYKADFDIMINDFSSETLVGTNTNGVVSTTGRLRVLVDSANTDFPSTPDAAIFKLGTGTHDIDKFDGIGFKMRLVGGGTLDYSNLILALRGSDAHNVYEINLADALNPDTEALPELSSEWADVIISPLQSLEDDTVTYTHKDSGEPSDLAVMSEILGFHLYAKGECSQVVEIEEVYLVKGSDKTVLDSFDDRLAVNGPDPSVWWRDSTGFIVGNGVMLNGGASYETPEIADTAENLVLQTLGDTTGTTITPITENGAGDAIAWADLKDQNNNPVVNAVNGAYGSYVINLANSGIDAESLKGIKISSTTEVYVRQIFLSNLQDKAALTEYPLVGANQAAMFDNFNRTQSGFDGDYDASILNPVVIEAGIVYAVSYNNADKVSVADGHVTFDATNLGAEDYINFKEGSHAYDGHKYLVMSMKLEDGATLDNFRINVGNKVVYANQWLAGAGLPSIPTDLENYPYVTEDGYVWYIVDLKESDMVASVDLDMYYTGTGKLLIDCIFYCNEYSEIVYEEKQVITNATVESLTDYAYVTNFDNPGSNLVKVTFSSTTEGQTLKSIRLEAGATVWFKDGAIKDSEGNVISGDTAVTAEGVTVVIDLEASGLNSTGLLHIHSGGFDGSAGNLIVNAWISVEDNIEETKVIDNATVESLTDYAYVTNFDNPGVNLVQFTFSSTTEGQTLKSVRLEAGATVWFKDGAIKDSEGNVISGDTAVTAEGVTVVIDLEASGLNSTGLLHIHSGGFDGSTGNLTVNAWTLVEKTNETKVIDNVTVESLTDYAYITNFDNPGSNLVKVTFSSTTEGQTLKSVRLEAGATVWFKDGAIKDSEGNVISGDTAVTAEGVTVVIDLEASGLNSTGLLHIHSGGFDGSTGNLTVNAWTCKEVTYTDVLGSLIQ